MRASSRKTDFVARATAAWGEPPDWIVRLAEACSSDTQTVVAKRLGYSASAISATLANAYRGDVGEISERVRGAFMSAVVECPRKGTMNRNTCLQWQDKPFAATSADRVAMFHACRSGCPHSRLKVD
ncbi:transcriptional regulator [Methylobacterium iners]|uniref:Transcriptional regulator n=1 Tax=Methylobacterium iners TaxID=418707 RepID=A0ABQ4S5A6_9HYPH|nr:transcriptional regulator [Methylobacterium iners]GJD97750.1 hypothetical protein OCOJLMKI_4983 [Methylobacterium iners]